MSNLFSRRDMLAAAGVMAAAVATSSVVSDEPSSHSAKAARKFRILVTGGHPGDPEYGCGGTVAKYADLGHDVGLLYLNRGDPTEVPFDQRIFPRVAEATKACAILKARPLFAGQIDGHAVVDKAHYDAFRKILAIEKPDAVFTHWPIDNHADHRAMSMLVYDAWMHAKKSFALFYYEVSTGEDTVQFAPSQYVDISTAEPRKRSACFAHASQSPERFYKLQETVAKFRGIESGHHQAEAFVRHSQSPDFALPEG